MHKKKESHITKVISWVIIVALLYVLTSAETVTTTVEIVKSEEEQKITVVEKLVNVTKQKEERVPLGTSRCVQVVYNFTKKYEYSESFDDGRTVKCVFEVKNEEEVDGSFSFYAQLIKNTGITEGNDVVKNIPAFGTERFEWNFTLKNGEVGECMLKSSDYPHKMRCFFLEPITYGIKTVSYEVEELKNVTEFTITNKENMTITTYVNKYFGYKQPFYLGY